MIVIKDGSINVVGAFVDNIIPYAVELNEDGSKSILEAKPCCNCGSEDLELVKELEYDPTLYYLRCTKCSYTIPIEEQDYCYFHDEGLVAAVKSWNIHCLRQEFTSQESYSSRENYWKDKCIEPEETYPISLSDMSTLYPVKSYSDTSK